MILYGTLFFIGLVIFYFAVKEYQKTRKVISEGIRVESTVIDFEIVKGGDSSDSFSPIFEYKEISGTTKTYTSKVASVKPSLKIGDTKKLIYIPNNEKGIKIDTYWDLYRWSIVLSCFAFPFLVIGGGYLLYVLK